MDKHQLRDCMADEIVSTIYQLEIRVVKSKLERMLETRFSKELSDYKKGINFISAVISSLEQEGVLLTENAVIGLTPLGRMMGASGGYSTYQSQERINRVANRCLLGAYYVTAILAALVATGIIHFSKSHDVVVPSVGFALFGAVTGGLVRDIIPRVSRLTAQLFQRKG